MKKRFFALLMAIVMITGSFAVANTAFAADSGSCGTNVTWAFANGVLTISGTYSTSTYSETSKAPWIANSHSDDIKQVVVSEGVTGIGAYTFAFLTNLGSITLPSTVTAIDPTFTYGCPTIDTIKVASGNTVYTTDEDNTTLYRADGDLGTLVRFHTNSAASFSIPRTFVLGSKEIAVKSVGDYAFINCDDLSTVTFGAANSNGVYDGLCEKIGKFAFFDSAITTVKFSNSVRFIDAAAFKGTKLTGVVLSLNVNSIGTECFRDCTALKALEIYNTLIDIGDKAFYGCSALTSDNFIFHGQYAEWSNKNLSSRIYNGKLTLTYKSSDSIICYDANGGFGAPDNIYISASATTLSTAKPVYFDSTKEFLGWMKSKTGTTLDYKAGDTYSSTTGIHLYALWGEMERYLQYDANASGDTVTNMPNPIKQTYDKAQSSYTIASSIPVRDGYTFLGWSTSEDGNYGQYQPGGVLPSVDGGVTLYAVWIDNGPYTLSYDANGGTGAPDAQTKIKGTDLLLSTVVPTRDRYKFTGWKCSFNSSVYQPGDTYKLDVKCTFTAQWTLTGKRLVNINGTSTYYDQGVAVLLPAAPETRDGYTFSWSVAYTDNNGNSQTVNMYPGDNYTLNYDANIKPVYTPINQNAGAALSISTASKTVDYRSKVHITATVTNAQNGCILYVYAADGRTALAAAIVSNGTATVEYTSSELTSDTAFSVVLKDTDGNIAKYENLKPIRANITVKVDAGFFKKIIAFFRSLFGKLQTIDVA